MLCRHFLREVYDGQIFVKLKKGMHFPGLDFWVSKLDSGLSFSSLAIRSALNLLFFGQEISWHSRWNGEWRLLNECREQVILMLNCGVETVK